jgi:hypothetical protein
MSVSQPSSAVAIIGVGLTVPADGLPSVGR